MSIIFGLIGIFVASFTLLSACICIFFALPLTKKLDKSGKLIDNHPIYKNYLISIVLLTIIWLCVFFAIKTWGSPQNFNAFIIGSVFTLIIGMGQMGFNKNNMSDYMNRNQIYFKIDSAPTP